ncbi:hypothetical protein C8R44DRAFT_570700, partial [Mycena epipterygia]
FSEIYFIDSSTQQTIENDLATVALAKQIGKTAEDSLLWLSHQPTEWLIVFNNADDIHLNLADFFPSGSHGNILVTSCNPDLRQHAQAEQKVDQMECEDSIDLLLAAARYNKTAEAAEISIQIVQRLHCLPLAVAQAGSYISSSHALHKYLDLYENTAKRIQRLNQAPPQLDYEPSVYTSWQMSFDKLSNRAAKLLQLCSSLHHDGITEEIFERASSYEFVADGPIKANLQEPSDFLASFLENSTWDSMKFVALTDELRRYSLIQLEESSRHVSFSIHPLVHEWCHSTVESDTIEVCMHRLMGMSISSAGIIDGEKLADSMLGNHNIKESETLDIQLALVTMYEAQGRLDDVKGLEEVVLRQQTESLGHNHSSTLVVMANLAATYWRLGQLGQAAKMDTTVLNTRREILGEDHPGTLQAMANLAHTHTALGELNQAEEL